jgi:hypothetical protein
MLANSSTDTIHSSGSPLGETPVRCAVGKVSTKRQPRLRSPLLHERCAFHQSDSTRAKTHFSSPVSEQHRIPGARYRNCLGVAAMFSYSQPFFAPMCLGFPSTHRRIFPWIATRLGRVHETCGENRAGFGLRSRIRTSRDHS